LVIAVLEQIDEVGAERLNVFGGDNAVEQAVLQAGQ